jgi:putative solute:sodium symporter small subunit
MAVQAAAKAETRWTMNRVAVLLLMSGWAMVAVLTFAVDGFATLRFLDLPIGAYLAGQGAMVAGVLVAVRISRGD